MVGVKLRADLRFELPARSRVEEEVETGSDELLGKFSAAVHERRHVAPHARHARAIPHGTRVAASEVTRCAGPGAGAVPAPIARARAPTRPG